MNWLINIGIYQLTWFVVVLGGNRFAWIPLLLLVLHFRLTPCRRSDALLVAAVLAIGVIVDGSLIASGLFRFSDASGVFIPYWLAVLWAVLGTLPNHSLRWMKRRWFLCVLFGALGGPLAYWAGVRLGAAAFDIPPVYGLAVLALVWGILWPLVMLLSLRFECRPGFAPHGRTRDTRTGRPGRTGASGFTSGPGTAA